MYVGATPRARPGGGKDACGRAWALWADCDSREAVDRLAAFEPAPTFTILSGGTDGGVAKTHAWWALREPLDRDDLEPALKRLAHRLGADPACAEIARVMRPPATLHRKDGQVRRVLCATSTLDVYTVADVTGALPVPLAEKPPAPRPRAGTEVRGDDPLRWIPATEYVPALLRQAPGRDGKVICPFHEDWIPSLHVYDDDRGWFCFQCQSGGSIVDLGARLYGITPRGRGYHNIRRRLADDLLGEQDA